MTLINEPLLYEAINGIVRIRTTATGEFVIAGATDAATDTISLAINAVTWTAVPSLTDQILVFVGPVLDSGNDLSDILDQTYGRRQQGIANRDCQIQ